MQRNDLTNLAMATPHAQDSKKKAEPKLLSELEHLATASEYYSVGKSAISATQFAAMEFTQQSFLTAGIRRRLWALSCTDILSLLFAAIINICTYNLTYFYCGLKAISVQASVLPLTILLCKNPPQAFFSSVSNYILRAVMMDNVTVANIYVNHVLFVAILWSVIISLIFAIFSKQLLFLIVSGPLHDAVDFTFARQYLLVSFLVLPILYTFSYGPNVLIKLENRDFLYLTKTLYLSMLNFLFLFGYILITSSKGKSLGAGNSNLPSAVSIEAVAYISAAAHLVIAIWMFFLFIHRTVLDVPVHGGIRFSVRRLFPINWRVVLRIVLNSMASWCGMSVLTALIFVLDILYARTHSRTDVMMYSKTAYYNYMLMYNLASVFLDGMRPSFATLVQYNYSFHNYKRVYNILKVMCTHCFIATGLLCLILGLLADSLIGLYQPTLGISSSSEIFSFSGYGIPMYKSVGKMAFYTPCIITFYNIAQVMSTIDDQKALYYLFMVVRPVTIFILLISMALTNGDGADLSVCFVIGDGISGAMGLIVLVYYILKFRKMARRFGDTEAVPQTQDLPEAQVQSEPSDSVTSDEMLDDESTNDITLSYSNNATEESSFTASSRQ